MEESERSLKVRSLEFHNTTRDNLSSPVLFPQHQNHILPWVTLCIAKQKPMTFPHKCSAFSYLTSPHLSLHSD